MVEWLFCGYDHTDVRTHLEKGTNLIWEHWLKYCVWENSKQTNFLCEMSENTNVINTWDVNYMNVGKLQWNTNKLIEYMNNFCISLNNNVI